MTGTAAVVKIVLDSPAVKFTDYMSMLPLGVSCSFEVAVFRVSTRVRLVMRS